MARRPCHIQNAEGWENVTFPFRGWNLCSQHRLLFSWGMSFFSAHLPLNKLSWNWKDLISETCWHVRRPTEWLLTNAWTRAWYQERWAQELPPKEEQIWNGCPSPLRPSFTKVTLKLPLYGFMVQKKTTPLPQRRAPSWRSTYRLWCLVFPWVPLLFSWSVCGNSMLMCVHGCAHACTLQL